MSRLSPDAWTQRARAWQLSPTADSLAYGALPPSLGKVPANNGIEQAGRAKLRSHQHLPSRSRRYAPPNRLAGIRTGIILDSRDSPIPPPPPPIESLMLCAIVARQRHESLLDEMEDAVSRGAKLLELRLDFLRHEPRLGEILKRRKSTTHRHLPAKRRWGDLEWVGGEKAATDPGGNHARVRLCRPGEDIAGSIPRFGPPSELSVITTCRGCPTWGRPGNGFPSSTRMSLRSRAWGVRRRTVSNSCG